ncbi:HU family DNA-binding protein [Fusobacterium ulcerans]|uniref:HU family DNA-binding protein n=1 Tax=Fusobacterium ulcerans TaxID=861 RepID=UPI0030B3BC89
MTEGEFIRFYKKRNRIKSHKEVKEKIDLFWDVLLKALEEDKKVIFKEWGTFEKKEMKSRKVLVPMWEKPIYTEAREAIKFRAGKGLIKIANGGIDE